MNSLSVGITGGIASGKSTVAEYFESKGYKIISADECAKRILVNNSEVKQKIIKAFGSGAYSGDELNTKYLAEIVFSDEHNTKKINAIVHPLTIREIEKQIVENFSKYEIVFTEAALIYEAKMDYLFDYIILVTADDDIKIKRASERSGESAEKIKQRIDKQIPDEKKKNKADFVIINNNSKEELIEKAGFVLKLLKNLPFPNL